MDSKQFYSIVNQFRAHFEQQGLKKRGQGYASSDGRFKVRFVLDRNGWDPELGWGFLVEATDESARDEWNNLADPTARIQIGGRTVQQKLDAAVLRAMYADFPKVRSLLQANWVGFANEQHAHAVLAAALPPLIQEVAIWIGARK